jgi:branched-chain amino acid aminotransferase
MVQAMMGEFSQESDLDWGNVGFGRVFGERVFLAQCNEGVWSAPRITPASEGIPSHVFNSGAHYGQSVFEGMKAVRSPDGRVVIVAPVENWKRFTDGARRMALFPVPEKIFHEGIAAVIRENPRYIPPFGKAELYIRPLLLGTGPMLGLSAARQVSFMVCGSPVNSYFTEPVALLAQAGVSRGLPCGTSSVKAGGNYAAWFEQKGKAQAEGFNELLFLDHRRSRYPEEAGSANLFFVYWTKTKGFRLVTPSLESRTILPGITRRIVMALARRRGWVVEEKNYSIAHHFKYAVGAFCTGTAVGIGPIKSITYRSFKTEDKTWHATSRADSVIDALRSDLVQVRSGEMELEDFPVTRIALE